LNNKINSLLKTQIFQEKKKDVFDFAYQSLEKDEDLQMIFSEMVMDDDA